MRTGAARSVARGLAYATVGAAAAYAARAGAVWLRYARVRVPPWSEHDALLDCFMPYYEVRERHRVHVHAAADATFAAACQLDLEGSGLVNAIFNARALILGSRGQTTAQRCGLLERVRALGWVVLIEQPGREIVLGAATRPWEADVVFRSIPPEQFAGFEEPGYVKIAWTLRADPIGGAESIARTETRVITTDAAARRRFRRYWSVFSPGIIVIRWLMLAAVKREAERRAGATGAIERV